MTAAAADARHEAEEHAFSLWALCLLSLVVGAVTGFGALAFRTLTGLLHNLFFFGQFSLAYDANHFTPASPWGLGVTLVPVIGGLGVVWLVRNFAPEARGHGVPEVMHAIYYAEGRIRPKVVVIKSLASALSIGSGAAVGREGPIIQIGSAIGSTFGQLIRIAVWQRVTLVAAGAGAGIAATFNTPLGGVLFAIELLLPEISTRTFLPVVIATGTATYVARSFFGMQPAFIVPIATLPDPRSVQPAVLIAFVVLGALCGLASWAFIRLLTFMEQRFQGMPMNPYAKNAIGMFGVGLMMYLLFLTCGHYYIEGVGYGTIQAILQGNLTAAYLLLFLAGAKILATCVSLGAGASGGVFAPSLFIGATLGAGYGAVLAHLGLPVEFSLPEFAMVGMASVVGGATGGAITAIVMIFEMTRDYNVIVPMILGVAIAIGVRRVLSPENIYTVKLLWRGVRIPKDRHSNMFLIRPARELMSTSIAVLPADLHVAQALQQIRQNGHPTHILVERDNHILGVVPLSRGMLALREVRAEATLEGIAERQLVVAPPDQIMSDSLPRLFRRKAAHVIVVEGGGVPRADAVVGIISREQIADAVVTSFGSCT